MTLKEIRQAIIEDPDNKAFGNKGWVPVYTAHESARIVIIGQAPGRLAQESSKPWNDPSGNNLRSWMGVDTEAFYDETKIALVPMDFYFPGTLERGDAPPRKDFAQKWHPLILKQMHNVQLTILIGQYAHKRYLENTQKKTLTETVRNFNEYLPDYFPLVHPSPRNNIWQKKNPWFKDELLPIFQKTIKDALG